MSKTAESPSVSVERALSILEAVAQRGGMTNAEISVLLEIPKSSASYILRVLERRGYLRRDADSGRYRLGLKLLALSHGVETGGNLRATALPFLRQLVERAHTTAHLAVLDRNEMVYVEKVDAPGFVKIDTWVGRRNDVYSSSVGKALLAHMPPEQAGAILSGCTLAKRTPKTITSQAKLMRELERVRAQGYAVDDEENSLGVRCIAAPVFDGSGVVLGAVNVTGTTAQIEPASIPRLAELVKDAGRKLSHQFGYRAPHARKR